MPFVSIVKNGLHGIQCILNIAPPREMLDPFLRFLCQNKPKAFRERISNRHFGFKKNSLIFIFQVHSYDQNLLSKFEIQTMPDSESAVNFSSSEEMK